MRSDITHLRLVPLLIAVLSCTSSGNFEGEIERPRQAAAQSDEQPPSPTHERVQFSWVSDAGGESGVLRARLPTGQVYAGTYHQITRTTRAVGIDPFYGAWYGGWWYGPGWTWGGAWPYYGTVDQFITYYTGKVVALLDDGNTEHMRCRFDLIDAAAGMAGGGTGECQTSSGARITAWFGPEPDATLS